MAIEYQMKNKMTKKILFYCQMNKETRFKLLKSHPKLGVILKMFLRTCLQRPVRIGGIYFSQNYKEVNIEREK